MTLADEITSVVINPNLEALSYGKALGVFVDDDALTFRGQDGVDFLQKIKEIFSTPQNKDKIKCLEPSIQKRIPELIKSRVLVEQRSDKRRDIDFFGEGQISRELQNFINCYPLSSIRHSRSLLICIPDCRGLSVQNQALASLKENQFLLTGITRGTTAFVLPLINSQNVNLLSLFERLLATEIGIGNLYLANELADTQEEAIAKRPFDSDTARWIASDIWMLIKHNKISEQGAHIYRGTSVLRESVPLVASKINILHTDTIEEKTDALIKKFVGSGRIVARIRSKFIGNSDRPLFMANTETARARKFLLERETSDCWGVADTLAKAKLIAIMESIERYASASYSLDEYPLMPLSMASAPVATQLIPIEYQKNEVFRNTPRRWCPVNNLMTNRKYVLPIEYIYYPVNDEEVGYEALTMVNSSGVAAHFVQEIAVTSACHELAERDAFLIAWLRKARPPLIDLDTLPESVVREMAFLGTLGFTIKLVDLSTDIAPVICALLIREATYYQYSIGAASNDDIEAACLKALREAQMCFNLPLPAPRSTKEILENLQTPGDHMELYAAGEHVRFLTDIFSSNFYKSFGQIARFKGSIVERIQEKGMHVFAADLSSPLVSESTDSIHVVRAIIPDLVPIRFGKNWAEISSPRIRQIPELMGWETEANHVEQYQSFPHPFP